MTIRIGIIGAGLMGDWHAQRWRRLPVTIAGFYDVAAERAAELADQYGATAFASLEGLAKAVDVVQICSPSIYHLEAAQIAAAHGKAIFCEKPLARHGRDAQEIIAIAEAAGSRLYVGQVLRFFHQYRRAKQALDDGDIGVPWLIRAIRAAGHAAELGDRRWFADMEMTGGVAYEVSLHDIDFACWCLGPVQRVLARGLSYREDLP
ncbi:MAG: Gfo/Idh/MocA family oxidoreductase, partial [Chloroflexi bacterium]|nr:Gfo/Idh/MocA family oxidoreductase [Chloroflexota bacterium]